MYIHIVYKLSMTMIQTATVLLTALLLTELVTQCALGQYQGDKCRPSIGGRGRCMPLRRCIIAQQLLQYNVRPDICGFRGRHPIVCCPRDAPQRYDNIVNEPTVSPGTKSKQKCAEYSGESPTAKSPDTATFRTFVVGGKNSLAKEFPHMAALGFGDETDKQWLCGGSLISEQYVMTAAHCTYTQQLGEVRWVRLGDLNLHITTDDAQPQDFQVIEAIRHPEHTSPVQYHDIALLKLDRPVEITSYVKPACLQVEHDLPDTRPIATGWGRLEFVGDTSDHLQKVDLDYFSNEQCRTNYANIPPRRLPNGIVDQMQVCAGGVNAEKDTCQGDSGGPLQIKDGKQCYIVGITSFGRGCGSANVPGVYTRVSFYVPWIEQIVWPNA